MALELLLAGADGAAEGEAEGLLKGRRKGQAGNVALMRGVKGYKPC